MSDQESVVSEQAGRVLRRISGVRSSQGGRVRLVELTDGWAVFPDDRARFRVWQFGCGIALALALGAEALLQRGNGPAWAEGVAGLAAVGLFVVIISLGTASNIQATGARRRTRTAGMLRAGGRDALGRAVRQHGRVRTVGEMNILLSSLGRTDPVYATRAVRHGQVRRRWWQTTVDLTFDNGKITYRVSGIRAPSQLANVFELSD